MKYRALGGTGLRVSEVGFGTWGLGGTQGGSISYGPADDEQSLAALRCSLEAGINFFDTADLYGYGHSEKLLGLAFEGRRPEVVIATKAGLVTNEGAQDFSPAHLRRSLVGSLERLRSDYVDLFMLHNPPLELLASGTDVVKLLADFQTEGKIRAWGISVRSPADGLAAVEKGCPVIQVNFNLTDQRARQNGLLDLCVTKQAGCIIRTPLCFGFLTGQYPENINFAEGDHRRRWAPEQRKLWADAGRAFNAAVIPLPGQTPAQMALRFCLSYQGVSTTIPGMLTAGHVDDNAAASDMGPMAAGELARLEKLAEEQEFFLAQQRPAQHNVRS